MAPSPALVQPSDAVTASYRWMYDAFALAQKHHLRGQRGKYFFLMTGATLLFMALAIVVLDALSLPRSGAFIGALGGFEIQFFIFRMLWSKDFLKAQWNAGQREHQVTYQFIPEGLTISEPLSSATMRWDAFCKIVETRDGFLLYPQTHIFQWVPFEAFQSPSHVDCARDMIIRSEVPFKALPATRKALPAA